MNKKRMIALGAAALLVILAVGNLAGTKTLPNETKVVNAEERFSLDAVESSLKYMDANGSAVYFTSDISPNGLMEIYRALGWTPTGKVAVKLSTGEPPASNYLRPELIRDLVQSVSGTIVECNTAYGGSRTETAMHMQVAEDHGFTDIADVDILDADGSMQIPVTGGSQLKTNYVGSHFENYDSYLVLSHFKGHAMAGFGGAIKNISIGLGSKEGKCLIHTGGKSHTSPWGGDQTAFTESMAEAGKAVSDYLGNGDRITYISVLNNISIDCDCDGNPAEPDIHDIGILASNDPVAIDQAAIDLCFAAEGSDSLKQRVERQNGLHTLEHGEEIGLGSRNYNLINIQEENSSGTSTPAATENPSDTPSDGESVTEPDSEEQTAKVAMEQAKIKKLKATGAKKKISISWKKVGQATGYQVQVSRTGKFKKKDIIFNKKVKKASAKASGKKIKRKKTYYVRVRAYADYTDEEGEEVQAYGGWAKKKVKTK